MTETNNKEKTIQNIQSKIDDIKDKISDNEYLELCNDMKKLNTQQNTWYKFNYLEIKLRVIDDEDNLGKGDTIITYEYKNCIGRWFDGLPPCTLLGCPIWINFETSTINSNYDFDYVCGIKKNGCEVRTSRYILLSVEPIK